MIVGNGSGDVHDCPADRHLDTRIAGVYDSANITVYINGVSDWDRRAHGTRVPSNALALRIGGDSAGGSLFSGAIDEVRVWKRGMTAAQIATLYAAGRARMTQASGQMVAWFSSVLNHRARQRASWASTTG